jgi:hypothetical protein
MSEDFAVKQFTHVWLQLAESRIARTSERDENGWSAKNDERFLDYILTERLHPVPIAFRFIVVGDVYAMIVDGSQQLPHCQFVHKGLELFLKREGRWLIALFPFRRGSRRAIGRLGDGVGCRVAQPEQV